MITNDQLTEAILQLREAQIQTDKQMKETDKQIKENARQMKEKSEETDKQIKENARQMKERSEETDKKIRETAKQMKENAKQMKERSEETDKKIKELSQNISGVNKSIGLEVEDFFYSSLKKNPTIANINFDYIYQNDKRNIKGKTQEIDILLENGNSIGIVEVKNKVSEKSIEQLDKIINNFYFFHKDYEGYKIVGALAGKIFPKNLQVQTLKKGYSVITQQGEHIEQINPN